jgi:hypothetical protein
VVGQPFYEGFEAALEAVLDGRHTEGLGPAAVALAEATKEGWRLRDEADAALEKGDAKTAVAKLDALAKIDPERWWWEIVEATQLRAGKLADPASARKAAIAAIDGVSKRNPHALVALAEVLLSLPAPHREPRRRSTPPADALTFGADEDVKRVLGKREPLGASPERRGGGGGNRSPQPLEGREGAELSHVGEGHEEKADLPHDEARRSTPVCGFIATRAA